MTVLQWFSSYLSDHLQPVTIGSISSESVPLQLEFPRRLYWAPFCSLCTHLPLSDVIPKYQFNYHKYADDTKLQKAALLSNFSQVSRETEDCVTDVKEWMNLSLIHI